MKKYFNTTGVCVSRKHYMVNIEEKLKGIETQEPEYAENLLKFVCNIQSLSDLSMKVIHFREGLFIDF